MLMFLVLVFTKYNTVPESSIRIRVSSEAQVRLHLLDVVLPRLDLLQGLLYGLRHLHINRNQMTEYPPASP